MSQGASSAGLVDLSVFAILIYVMQGFAGYPLTAIMLQREGKTLLARYRCGEHRPDNIADEHAMLTVGEEKMPRLFSKIPVSYNSNYFKFLRLALVGLACRRPREADREYQPLRAVPVFWRGVYLVRLS